jgi:hypothetical protein
MPNAIPPVYACGYSDPLDHLGKDGCFPATDGLGLGVRYDWRLIARVGQQLHVVE